MSPEQALTNLYQASNLAKLTAQEHQVLAECAKILSEAIKVETKTAPADEGKSE